MSAVPFRFAWERVVRDAGLKPTQMAVALMVATYANTNDGHGAWPGQQRLAEGIDVTTRTVSKTLGELCELGYLSKVREGNSRAGQADEYALTLPDHRKSDARYRKSGADHRKSDAASPEVSFPPQGQAPVHEHQNIYTVASLATAEAVDDPWEQAARG
jgi:hypothetical protein